MHNVLRGGQKIFVENHGVFFLRNYTLACLSLMFKYFLFVKSTIFFAFSSIESGNPEQVFVKGFIFISK